MTSIPMKRFSKKEVHNKNTGLRKCFCAMVDRKQANFDIEVLNLILKNELLIDLSSLTKPLAKILPYLLVIYIKTWPGWENSIKYYSGIITFKDWFWKFHQYIVKKLHFVITKGYMVAIDETTIARFKINITCSPNVMNTLVFANNNDNVIVRQHPAYRSVEPISIQQLLNMTYVTVDFMGPEISFTRKYCTEFIRYLQLSTKQESYNFENEDVIDSVDIIDPNIERQCYTFRMISEYGKQYIETIKTITKGTKYTVDIAEVSAVFQELLADIEEINVNNSIATNTSVIFNIGKNTYVRNKRLCLKDTDSSPDVEYWEEITPKVNLSFLYFRARQETSTPHISFKFLNNLKFQSDVLEASLPRIQYGCAFCDISGLNSKEIVIHFNKNHQMEQGVVCVKCKEPFDINCLVKERWHHVCKHLENSKSNNS